MKGGIYIVKADMYVHGKKNILIVAISLTIIIGIGIVFFTFCTPIFVSGNSDVYVVFKYDSYNPRDDRDIYEKLTDDEAKQVTQILNGHITYDDPVPSCGFDDDIALIVGDKRYCIARDLCPFIECDGKYFSSVSQEQIDTIRKIMGKYGAYFPCI